MAGDPLSASSLSRRDLARWAVLGGSALAMSHAIPARATTHSPPATPWWLDGNFAPVTAEVERAPLEVDGALPPELVGTYVRNGSNPVSGVSPHWFFGDGMVHGVRLEHGKAAWYRNRYVHTTMYEARAAFGQGPPGGASNQSNVSAIWHGGRLLTSGEVGLPYRLDPATLDTLGPFDFAGRLTSAFTAHPKIDPTTGRLHGFGYGFVPPFLTYWIVEPDGTLSHSSVVDIPASTMIHDFAITEHHAVFWDLPVRFDLAAAVAYVKDPTSGIFPYRWDPATGARLGVMPLDGSGPPRWFDLDPCYVFHGLNAYEDGDQVVVDVCHLDSIFRPGQTLGNGLATHRWRTDPASGRVADTVLTDGRIGELPTRDPRLVGRPYRFAYLVENRPSQTTVDLGGVIKLDVGTGDQQVWDPGPGAHGGEWLFVPTSDGEDHGYLLGFVYDTADDASELVVLDATAVANGPVARIRLPQRVPYGFHGTWIPG